MSSELSKLRAISALSNSERALFLEGATRVVLGQCGGEGGATASDEPSATLLSRALVGVASLGLLLAGPLGLAYLRTRPLGAEDSRLRSHQHTQADVAVYWIETYFSSAEGSKTLALGGITCMLIAAGSGALFAVSGLPANTVVWRAIAGVGLDWTFVGEEDESFAHRAAGLLLSIGGMLVTALLVSLISEAFSVRMDELRKGRSDVLETNHTLILGWSDKVIPIIRQIALANESEGGGAIVVLAGKDKEEMDQEVQRLTARELLGTRVICRNGSALRAADLGRVSVRAARAIVVLADDGSGTYRESADVNTLRVVLVLSHLRENGGLPAHVVTELFDIDNDPLIRMVGGDMVSTLVSHDVIGRLMLQCARQPGLAAVFEDLICFEGSEFYFKHWPQLVGRTFGEACFLFPAAVPCGLELHGKVHLNPPDSTVLTEAHRLIVIAEDDDSYEPVAEPYEPNCVPHRSSATQSAKPEKVLFVGWRRDLQDLVAALDEFVGPGSELFIMADMGLEERHALLLANGMDPEKDLKNLTLKHVVGDPVSRKHLSALPLERFDSVLLLAHGAEGDDQTVMDSKTLTTLLQIRTIQATRLREEAAAAIAPSTPQTGMPAEPASSSTFWSADMRQHSRKCPVISEILNLQTRHLVAEMGICDYVLSNELISNAIAAVAEEPLMSRVWDVLFCAEGDELYVLPASIYVAPGELVSFATIAARARSRDEVLLGIACSDDPASFRSGHVAIAAEDDAPGEEEHARTARRAILNPPEKTKPLRWDLANDFVVILARDLKV